MKAVKYSGFRNAKIVDIPKLQITDDEVLVKVKYCGICGTDIHAFKMGGVINGELILGHESVGIVEEVGKNIRCVKVGDRVAVGSSEDWEKSFAYNNSRMENDIAASPKTLGIGVGTKGTYAEYVVSKFPENELIIIPENLEFDKAVLFDLVGVGFHAVRTSEMNLGDCVIVSGCGSVGLSVVQSTKLAGASTIIAFDPDALKRELALKSGADYVLDPNDIVSWGKARKLLEISNGAQVCFEAAGNTHSIDTCIELCTPGGQIVLIGNDGTPYQLVTAALGPFRYNLKFSFSYTKEDIIILFQMIQSGKFDLSVFSTLKVPFSEAVTTLEKIEAGDVNVARVLLMPNK